MVHGGPRPDLNSRTRAAPVASAAARGRVRHHEAHPPPQARRDTRRDPLPGTRRTTAARSSPPHANRNVTLLAHLLRDLGRRHHVVAEHRADAAISTREARRWMQRARGLLPARPRFTEAREPAR